MIRQSAKQYGLVFDIRDLSNNLDYWSQRVFPHKEFPVVIAEEGQRVVKQMNYSLVPKWSQVRRPKFSTYNCRIESVCEKPTWREPIKRHRCLVGFTSFYESCYEGSHAGNVVEFQQAEHGLLVAAGIWEQWVDKSTGEVLDSFAIITTKPDPYIKSVGHDRSPLFLPQSNEVFTEWLDIEPKVCAKAKDFLLSSYQPPDLKVDIERPLKAGWDKK